MLPSEVPARANIWALKSLGVEFIISVSAVGSLREDIEPLHLVVPDQLIDRTRGRQSTFFGNGLVAHVAFGDPFCGRLRAIVAGATRETAATVHNGGTYVVMEGPAFSTRAESNLYRTWGADIIGMTALPEAKLAREAEICYAVLACSTDYDCWHDAHEDVTAEMIVGNLLKNVAVSRQAVRVMLQRLPGERTCPCSSALKDAFVTSFGLVPPETMKALEPIVGRYVEARPAG
jgi:5'-methylthioadenosine phosphorylase